MLGVAPSTPDISTLLAFHGFAGGVAATLRPCGLALVSCPRAPSMMTCESLLDAVRTVTADAGIAAPALRVVSSELPPARDQFNGHTSASLACTASSLSDFLTHSCHRLVATSVIDFCSSDAVSAFASETPPLSA